jgi:hypothetical protein
LATLPDNALNPATGYVYIAEVGTARPSITATFDPTDPASWDSPVKDKWKPVGHTSLENGLEFTSDGDDPETLGTWQVPNLRSTNPKKTYSVTINLADFTVETYKLYYGGGATSTVNGVESFIIPDTPRSQDRALLIVAVDGQYVVLQHFKRTSIVGSDSINYDPAALTEMPVTATILGGQPYGSASGQGEVTPRVKLGAS